MNRNLVRKDDEIEKLKAQKRVYLKAESNQL